MLPSLLRLLLCLCLLADAVGPAMAATHLAMADATADATAAAPGHDMQGGDADCHAAPAQVPGDAPAPDQDCLERCLELCLQHGVAAVPAMIALASPDPGAIPVRPAGAQVATAHATPILRPPIA